MSRVRGFGIPWTVVRHHPLAGIIMGGLVALACSILLHADGTSADEGALHGRGRGGEGRDVDAVGSAGRDME
jgi:hypothetical protein